MKKLLILAYSVLCIASIHADPSLMVSKPTRPAPNPPIANGKITRKTKKARGHKHKKSSSLSYTIQNNTTAPLAFTVWFKAHTSSRPNAPRIDMALKKEIILPHREKKITHDKLDEMYITVEKVIVPEKMTGRYDGKKDPSELDLSHYETRRILSKSIIRPNNKTTIVITPQYKAVIHLKDMDIVHSR